MKRLRSKFMAASLAWLASNSGAFAQAPDNPLGIGPLGPPVQIAANLDDLLNERRPVSDERPVSGTLVNTDTEFAKSAVTANDPYLKELAARDKADDNSFFSPRNFWAVAQGGASYYSVPHQETNFGGAYGGDAAHRLLGPIWLRGGVAVNHISGGTQFLGVVGLEKKAYVNPTGLWDHLAFLALFDQYTDSRIDGLYLTRFRFDASYYVTSTLSVGARYFEPVSGQSNVPIVNALGTAGVGSFQNARIYSAYVNTTTAWGNVEFEAGTRLQPDVFLAGLSLRNRLTDSIGTYTYTQYVATGQWAAGGGIEFRFGGARRTLAQVGNDIIRGSGGPRLSAEQQTQAFGNPFGGSFGGGPPQEIDTQSSLGSTVQALGQLPGQMNTSFEGNSRLLGTTTAAAAAAAGSRQNKESPKDPPPKDPPPIDPPPPCPGTVSALTSSSSAVICLPANDPNKAP